MRFLRPTGHSRNFILKISLAKLCLASSGYVWMTILCLTLDRDDGLLVAITEIFLILCCITRPHIVWGSIWLTPIKFNWLAFGSLYKLCESVERTMQWECSTPFPRGRLWSPINKRHPEERVWFMRLGVTMNIKISHYVTNMKLHKILQPSHFWEL